MQTMSPQPVKLSTHPPSAATPPCATLSPTRDTGVQTDITMKDVSAAISMLEHKHRLRTDPSPSARPASLLSLPDEVIERILEFVAELPPGTDMRACGLSDCWWDETECLPETLERERNLRALRLVSRDLLHLSMPVHLRWFSIVAPTSCTRPSWPHHVCAEADHQADAKRLVFFLSSSPPPRSKGSTLKEPAYGTYVRDLAFGHRAISASLGRVVFERVGDLMPNIRAVHLYSTAAVPPSILAELINAKLEFLEGITECSIPRPERNGDSLEESPHQDVLLRLMDARPRIQRFSTTGIALEGSNADRFLTILTTNRLYDWPGQASPIGLTLLHFANHCVVELALIEGLPKAAPNLTHLTIGSDCDLVDTKEIVNRFSVAKVVSALPKLRHFAFLGQKALPTAEAEQSTAWARCGEVLKDGPKISYLDLRTDQLSPDFFRAANKEPGPPHLLHQRLRHLILHASASNWAEVLILSSARRVRIFLSLINLFLDQGVPWPSKPEGLRDLFNKLKWMVDEREEALDANKLKMVVEVEEDGSARSHFVSVTSEEGAIEFPRLKHELFGESHGVVVKKAESKPFVSKVKEESHSTVAKAEKASKTKEDGKEATTKKDDRTTLTTSTGLVSTITAAVASLSDSITGPSSDSSTSNDSEKVENEPVKSCEDETDVVVEVTQSEKAKSEAKVESKLLEVPSIAITNDGHGTDDEGEYLSAEEDE